VTRCANLAVQEVQVVRSIRVRCLTNAFFAFTSSTSRRMDPTPVLLLVTHTFLAIDNSHHQSHPELTRSEFRVTRCQRPRTHRLIRDLSAHARCRHRDRDLRLVVFLFAGHDSDVACSSAIEQFSIFNTALVSVVSLDDEGIQLDTRGFGIVWTIYLIRFFLCRSALAQLGICTSFASPALGHDTSECTNVARISLETKRTWRHSPQKQIPSATEVPLNDS